MAALRRSGEVGKVFRQICRGFLLSVSCHSPAGHLFCPLMEGFCMLFPDGIRRIVVQEPALADISSFPLFRSVSGLNPDQYAVFPGFCDVHVHFREPGFSYKETIQTGAAAAAASGTTAVCTMPNLNPVPDSVEHLKPQLDRIAQAPIRGNPLQYSRLRNPMDRGAWQAIDHGVARVGRDLATKPPPLSSC